MPQTADTNRSRAEAERREGPRSVNSTADPCCGLHQWPVLPLQGSTEFVAHAAILTLRARAAENPTLPQRALPRHLLQLHMNVLS